jgi:serine/threonine-protein kinase
VAPVDLPLRIGGKYRPLRLLGKGGMGTVYEVEHEHTGQRLALKVLTSQPGASVERFRREARAASLIKSSHIVRVTDADFATELDGAPFLVMELLEGQDLGGATGDRPTPPPEVVEWLRQVARALTKAHEAGLVHRDLKPENLFLARGDDGAPVVKILDFGIAKMAAEASALTASDAFLGTPGYMAPEQTDSRGPAVTYRADLYTLGLIAFKLLTGRSYWRSGSLAQLLAQILAEPMPAASERGAPFGPEFDAWFRRACERDPEKRFGSAGEQIEALATVFGIPEAAIPSRATPVQTTQRTSDPAAAPSLNASFTDLTTARRRSTRRRLFGGGVAATLVSVGIVGALVHGTTNEKPARSLSSNGAATAPAPPTSIFSTGLVASEASTAPAASAVLTPLPPSHAAAASPPPSASASANHDRTPPAASNHAPPPGAGRAPAASAAAKGRDPLEGPW